MLSPDLREIFLSVIRLGIGHDAYISSRTKDDVIDLKVEKIFSADLSYAMNYRNFKGVVTAFFTDQRDNCG